ncbi:MAG: hypothetical protein KC776_42635, partial [Myxococcales bacterium]|nr:hypothetical protein [Myxococcales bacterium]
TEMVAIPTATASGPPPKPVDAQVIPPLGPEGLVKPALGEKLLPVLRDAVAPTDSVELELWFDDNRKVSKAVLHSPKLDADAEKKILDAARELELSDRDPDVRGQRFVVHFSHSDIAPSKPDASPTSKPVPVPTTHMKERVPRPEMAPRPPPPRPEMAPRPPKPGGNSGSGI